MRMFDTDTMETDTPRTDAVVEYNGWAGAEVVTANFARDLERENAMLRNRITTRALADALVQAYVIPPSAIEDPDGYDGYGTLDAIAKAADILSNTEISGTSPESQRNQQSKP